MHYSFIFILSFILAALFTLLVKKIALKLQIIDLPNKERKIHQQGIPLLGGLAIFASFAIVLIYYSFFTDLIIKDFILNKHILGILIAGGLIVIGGILDDKYDLPPKFQIVFPVLAIIIIIASGIGITHIRNPFGGEIRFDHWQIILFWYHGVAYKFTVLSDIFTFLWLLGMTYTTKLLDGLDGLVSGITIIGAIIIAGIAMNTIVAQPNTAIIALILAGSFLGFLMFNWHPAKIFLGEGGSLLAGFLLGVLAILSGSKVATTLLIMGMPILDVIYIIIWRLKEKKNPFKTADKKHLHFRLLDAGFSQRQAVLFYWSLTLLFGGLAIILQTFGKLLALVIMAIVMLILAIGLYLVYLKRSKVDKTAN